MVSNDDSLVSDVQNIDTIDLDTFYIGCDNRISKSTTITTDMVKYWLNVQNDLTVQRYLSIIGSAALGDVLIEYSSIDAIIYSIALNGANESYKNIIKTISSSQLDYTENNATINGWINDYVKNLNDISSDYTVVTGTNMINAYDDVMDSYGSWGIFSSDATCIELSFSSRTISKFNLYYYWSLSTGVGSTATIKAELNINGVWTVLDTHSIGANSSDSGTTAVHNVTGWNLVTGFRISFDEGGAAGNTLGGKIYDISMFE